MADSTSTTPKPSSSVKLVLLGEAAVGKVSGQRDLGNPSNGSMLTTILLVIPCVTLCEQ